MAGYGTQTAHSKGHSNQAQQEFVRLSEASPAMLWMANRNGLWSFASKTWLEFRGRSLDLELGSGWSEGIHPDDCSQSLRAYGAAVKASRDFRLQYRIRNKGGTYLHVENSGMRWFSSGEMGGYVGRILVLSPAEERVRSTDRDLSSLSRRERQMLELIALGYGTKEAAAKLGISFKTADSHRSHVLKKLRLHETASVVRFAIRAGLISA